MKIAKEYRNIDILFIDIDKHQYLDAIQSLLRLMRAVDDPHNGVTLCTGSLGSNPGNDIVGTIRALEGRVHFAHVRNLRHEASYNFV